ncbi:retrotransposon protein, putative, ty1-copia subclass [Tanacetum coccineum]
MHSIGKTLTELHAMLKLTEKGHPKKVAAPTVIAIIRGIFTIELYYFPNNSWVYDTGYGTHICNTTEGLRGSRKLKHRALNLYVGNGMHATIKAIRILDLILPNGLIIILDNFYYAPSITRGVVSLSRLVNNGNIHTFTNYGISVSKDNVIYFNVIPRDGIYAIDMHDLVPNVSSIYNVSNKRAKHNLGYTYLWYCRLGYINKKRMEKLQHDWLLKPIDEESFDKYKSCISGKMACEYMIEEFLDQLKSRIIVSQLIPPYTPQHNRVFVRRNRTFLDMVRSMMNLTTLLMSFWGYAQESATHILNMVPTKKVDKTPYILWHEKAPNLSYLKFFKSSLTSHKASESNLDLELIQDDTQPSENTREHHDEVVHEDDEPQCDIVPICIQVKDIVKEVEYYLKTYSSAGIDISCIGKTLTELHAMLKLTEKGHPKKVAAPTVIAIIRGIFTIELYYFPNNSWVYDTGYGTHICNTTEGLRGSRKLKHRALNLYVGNGMHATIKAIRILDLILPNGLIIILDNFYYAPSITRGVVSLSRLVNNGNIHTFTNYGISVSKDNVIYFNVIPRDGIYAIDMHDLVPNVSSIYNVSNKRAKHNLGYTYLWHCRLGYINKKRMEKLQHDWLLKPIDEESFDKYKSCISGKMACEYMIEEFLDQLKSRIIVSQLIPPYTPQHNRVFVRRNRTFLDMVRSMMNLTTLLMSFWGYAQESATHILNMVPTKKVDKTPYILWHEKAPNLSYLKFFKSSLTSHKASRSNLDLELIQDDTQPSENTREHHDEVVHEDDEPQCDIVPICRYARIPQAPY